MPRSGACVTAAGANAGAVSEEGAMPAYGRAFTDAQLRAIVTYIRSLKEDGR